MRSWARSPSRCFASGSRPMTLGDPPGSIRRSSASRRSPFQAAVRLPRGMAPRSNTPTLSFTGNLDETGLIIRQQAAPAVASHPVVEFKVADVAAVVARAKTQGAVVVSEPHTPGSANFIVAVLKDPDGNLVEILQPR